MDATTHSCTEASEACIYVAKQPIFDRKGQIWGFELLFRASKLSGTAQYVDANVATSQVLSDGFFLAAPSIEKNKHVLINFPKEMLLGGAAHTLPSEMCIIEILESVEPCPEVIAACRELKKAGFKLALDDFTDQPDYEELIGLADIVKVDILGQKPAQVITIFNKLKPYGCKLLAEKVENRKIFELTKKLGFDYFQGFFFRKPEIIPGKKISANESTKLKLMQEIGQEDFDFKVLADIISRDLSISYRLLRYVNSAYFGQLKKVDSLIQAIMILGQKQIVRWLRVILLSDMDAMGKVQVVAMTSVQRARFLELLGESNRSIRMSGESMFFLGIFSMIDVLLGIPMEEALKDLPLNEAVTNGLLGLNTQAHFWIELVESFEKGHWEKIDTMIKEKHLNPLNISLLYVEALKWTRDILSETV